ncbi:glycoside hydrolase family 3 C-terminal domain-containing protein, partial [Clostridioides difficile]|uniref:glycoside hydrolase family 3 C-terminal domain-containing protein n=1 Tax=Clostridioides difficile TaxID=1496 RepID=UPI00235866D0
LEESVEKGILDEKVVDDAVRRVLQVKFQLGLFEQPFVEEEIQAPKSDWKQLNLQAAREGICLLKNDFETLPLVGERKKIAVVCPSRDALYIQLGDYTAPQNESECVTVLEGIKKLLPKNWEVVSEKGTEIREELPDGIQRAEVVA